ncbi:hypothetical protein BC835DRAFT_527055 [Cytidiella melzeri]|nr:hypothetical protein BC835DRAFT_527055 [Cytidiella melzeri]
MPATASDPELPSELVYDILDLLISDLVYSCRPPHPSPVEVARVEENHRKRTLAACSLISFHWAQKFRPLLFCHLVLQSSEDVDTLNSFLRWKGSDRVPPISRYVERLSVAVCVQGTGTPWIHRVYPLLKKLGPGAELQSWHFNRYRPDNSTDIVTWAHRDIPRTLPGCYHAFTEVTLSDVHFPQYSTLMTLLASLPRLRHLRLERITWDAASDLSAGISLSVAGFTLHVNHCTDVALMAVQGLSRGHPNRRSQPSSLSLGSAEWRAVVNTIKFWTQNCWKGTRALYVEVQPLKKG